MPDGSKPKARPPKLDLNAVWSRALVLMRENFQLLAAVAGVFILVPSALIIFVLPPNAELQAPWQAMTDPNASAEMVERAAKTLSDLAAPFIAWSAVLNIVQHIGYGAMMAMMGHVRPTVGQAIITGFKSVVPLVIARLLFFSAIFAFAIIVSVILNPVGAAASTLIASLAIMLVSAFLATRLSMTLPIMVIEGRFNPIAALTRSWKLTAPDGGNIFGFWMALFVAYCVVGIVVIIVSDVIAAIAGGQTSATLIVGLFSGAFAVVYGIVVCACAVAMFERIAQPDKGDGPAGSK